MMPLCSQLLYPYLIFAKTDLFSMPIIPLFPWYLRTLRYVVFYVWLLRTIHLRFTYAVFFVLVINFFSCWVVFYCMLCYCLTTFFNKNFQIIFVLLWSLLYLMLRMAYLFSFAFSVYLYVLEVFFLIKVMCLCAVGWKQDINILKRK